MSASWHIRLFWLVALLCTCGALAAPNRAVAQGTLDIDIVENPFLCDVSVRQLGTVAGFLPGEAVEFSSPELNGVFSNRVADENGRVVMRWNCDRPQTWTITVRAITSGATSQFTLTGELAPPPPDAPLGAAFDNKTALTTAEMAIWKDFSPFSTAGIYISVNSDWDNRADKLQTNLSSAWVSEVFADGWSLIPIYVGRQAPDQCATARFEGLSMDPAVARAQGLESAADAVASVTRLGIGPGNPIYYDMEAYRPGCANAVITFLDAWTEGIHEAGYVSGVYGSRSSTMTDLSQALGRGGFDAPDAVWVSTGNGRPSSTGLEVPNDAQWAGARMHQYRLSVTRTYGGVTVEIDENIVNAPLARPQSVGAEPPSVPSLVDSDGDGIGEPSPDNCDNIANPDQADLDNDGDGDVCDRDIDGDGVDNASDFAPRDATTSTAPTVTPEPSPTATAESVVVDSDGDGFAEPSPDNCDNAANPDQADLDSDGDGDVCDQDIDGDGVDNELDQEPRDPAVGAPVQASTEPAETESAETESDSVETALDPTPVPTEEPAATAIPTSQPAQVVVLPTPPAVLPTVAAQTNTLPTPRPESVPAQDLPGDTTGGSSDTEAAIADDTMAITVEDDSNTLIYLIAALGICTAFCLVMGLRSFRASRDLAAQQLR